jgi:hypothetical protein
MNHQILIEGFIFIHARLLIESKAKAKVMPNQAKVCQQVQAPTFLRQPGLNLAHCRISFYDCFNIMAPEL